MLMIKMSDAYNLVFSDMFTSSVTRIKNKYKKLCDSIKRRANEIVNDSPIYKNLRYDISGLSRVHIGPFILSFSIDEETKTVTLEYFEHHDEAYLCR
jgi:mRNA-degrading endonuclease RelE of RelBE toxin-antitoxin system